MATALEHELHACCMSGTSPGELNRVGNGSGDFLLIDVAKPLPGKVSFSGICKQDDPLNAESLCFVKNGFVKQLSDSLSPLRPENDGGAKQRSIGVQLQSDCAYGGSVFFCNEERAQMFRDTGKGEGFLFQECSDCAEIVRKSRANRRLHIFYFSNARKSCHLRKSSAVAFTSPMQYSAISLNRPSRKRGPSSSPVSALFGLAMPKLLQ